MNVSTTTSASVIKRVLHRAFETSNSAPNFVPIAVTKDCEFLQVIGILSILAFSLKILPRIGRIVEIHDIPDLADPP